LKAGAPSFSRSWREILSCWSSSFFYGDRAEGDEYEFF
jgi:hypothetical protein